MPIDTIANFLPVTERLASAGQPTEEELRAVADEGFAVVVNLGLLDPRYCLPDEAGLVPSLGLRYHHIPVPFDAPGVDHFRAFLAVMDAQAEADADAKVFVHCAANYRVSSFLAVYGEMRLGWTREKADAHARSFWPLNEVWADFLARCRAEFLGG
jgi:protein tyrosine phosphatase (PTP) superfamily phosphohydrolase (DUF442 family)